MEANLFCLSASFCCIAPGPPQHPLQESSEIVQGLQSKGSLTISTLAPRDQYHFRNAENPALPCL